MGWMGAGTRERGGDTQEDGKREFSHLVVFGGLSFQHACEGTREEREGKEGTERMRSKETSGHEQV